MLEQFKHLVRRLLWSCDVDIKRRRSASTFESNLISLIDLHGVNLVIDVGANVGQFGELLRGLGYTGKIHSFEPNPHIFPTLLRTASAYRDWECHNIALGEEASTLPLYAFPTSVFSSLREASDVGRALFPSIGEPDKVLVQVRRVDEFFPNLAEDTKVLLKIDTQGYDIEVFRGAMSLVPSIRILIGELSFERIYNETHDWTGAFSIYRASGFVLSGLYPVSRTSDLRIIEADGVFCRPLRE